MTVYRFVHWAASQRTGSGPRKAVLNTLAMMADWQTGRCEAKIETLMEYTELSDGCIRQQIRALEAAGVIAKRHQYRRDGTRRGSEFLILAPGVEEWPDGEQLPARDDGYQPARGAGHNRHVVPGHPARGAGQEQPLNEQPLENNGSSQSVSEWVGVPDEMRSDAQEALQRKTKVSGRIVTPAEMQRAAASLAEFNRQLERSFSIMPSLDIVVRRAREHPSWDVAKHVRLVQSACRLRWWERNGRRRPPTPKVIWGSPECFENVAQDAAREAAVVSEREEDFALHDKVWPDGRRWSELSGREQQVAKDAVMMGLRPWEPAPAPVAAVSNGNGHAPGWTAANFAS